MRFHIVRMGVPLLSGACCSVASTGFVWQETFTSGPNGVTQFDTDGGNNMIGAVSE